ncbi:EAL domain-containing protein [Vibrio astriarenae]|uniref:EAL domain-containing protein n=1 Tax=Vibrio astriarenae TaxID=1481923 RepID=A0A7Z2YFA4_9VIBR|nr:GGDEF and EAL domain-containing protein [Vibrio astriarenae]QIA65298.1 EAL domain-containing protein [Vibrio astriarenae]
MSKVNTAEVVIPSSIQASWQKIVNLSAELIGVPSALITRIPKEYIEVIAANDNLKHPFNKRDTGKPCSELYCETVIKTQRPLCIPNRLDEKKWCDSTDVALGMIAYFGLPINWPNGEPFGTLCVLDTKTNDFSQSSKNILESFKVCIESHLDTLFQHEALKSTHQALQSRVTNRAKNIAALNYSLSKEISKRQLAEQKVEYQQHHDLGTGFLNRKALETQLSQSLAQTPNGHHACNAVIHIAFSNGRRLQSRFGYVAWDIALLDFRQRLEHLLPSDTNTARPTSSEIVLILHNVEDDLFLQQVCHSISDLCLDEFIIGNESVHLHAHIGVATSSESLDAPQLLTFASEAALSSRDSGHKYSFYQSSDSDIVCNLNKQESYLLQAVRNDDLLLYFQPKVDPDSHRWVGAEALLRWKHPVLGDISNEGLIKLAEQNGLIFELGNFVLRTAIEKAAQWNKLVSHFSVAINVSSVQLRNPYFARQVQELLEMCHVPPECIELEITEGGLISDEVLAFETLHKLKQLGITLSLDDFGTGYASFSYLKKYPFDAIKIDKSFLNQIEESAQDKEIVRSIIHVAKKLALKVTVEGVETQQHEDFLVSEGGDVGQGYFYGRPMPYDQFELHLLKQSPQRLNPRQIEL